VIKSCLLPSLCSKFGAVNYFLSSDGIFSSWILLLQQMIQTKIPMTILLVDDDDDDIAVFREALEIIDKSIIFMQAFNGIEALDILGSDLEHPDHIFLDINMPLMNGLECLTEIRKIHPGSKSIITVYSTSDSNQNQTFLTQMGAGYIQKPDTYKLLVDQLRKRLYQ
jgi:CheY-like chemotaxis protein